jgi:GINS complex subunit 4
VGVIYRGVDKYRFSQLTENHFRVSVLQALPPHQQGLDDNTPFTPPMSTSPAFSLLLLLRCVLALDIVSDSRLGAVSEPDKSHAVIVHARDECPPVRLPEYVLSHRIYH